MRFEAVAAVAAVFAAVFAAAAAVWKQASDLSPQSCKGNGLYKLLVSALSPPLPFPVAIALFPVQNE